MPEFLGIQHNAPKGHRGFYIIFFPVIIVFPVCLLVGSSVVDRSLRVFVLCGFEY